MKNYLLIMFISILTTNYLIADNIKKIEDFSKYPIPKTLTSQSRGGDLPDKIAATDGMGTIILNRIDKDNSKLDNSTYNKLLNENLSKLDNNNSLNNLIDSGKIIVSKKEIDKINNSKIGKYVPVIKTLTDGTKYISIKIPLNHYEAVDYCQSLNGRLPNCREYPTVYHDNKTVISVHYESTKYKKCNSYKATHIIPVVPGTTENWLSETTYNYRIHKDGLQSALVFCNNKNCGNYLDGYIGRTRKIDKLPFTCILN